MLFSSLIVLHNCSRLAPVEIDIIKPINTPGERYLIYDFAMVAIAGMRFQHVNLQTSNNSTLSVIIAAGNINYNTEFVVCVPTLKDSPIDFFKKNSLDELVLNYNMVLVIPDFRTIASVKYNPSDYDIGMDATVALTKAFSGGKPVKMISYSSGSLVHLSYLKLLSKNRQNAVQSVDSIDINMLLNTKNILNISVSRMMYENIKQSIAIAPLISIKHLFNNLYKSIKSLNDVLIVKNRDLDRECGINFLIDKNFLRNFNFSIIHSVDDEVIPIALSVTMGCEVIELEGYSHLETFACSCVKNNINRIIRSK